jgi:hypothetical protein
VKAAGAWALVGGLFVFYFVLWGAACADVLGGGK